MVCHRQGPKNVVSSALGTSKEVELQTALTAGRETEAEQQRLPNPQPLAEPPDDRAIALPC